MAAIATIQWVAVDALKPNARNARTHSRKQIHQIAQSIKAFGFLVPILIDEDHTILAGHGRYLAARSLGITDVPVVEVRGLGELLEVGGTVYGDTLNVVVWVKTNVGQGSFYRSQHELIGVFRVGKEAHLNNIELGRHGRTRSNVWRYAGTNTFRAGRMDDLKSHPTVKPVALVADAIKDCTRRGDIVLDTFSGSGTTILAAERVGRRAYALEIEPRFVDVAIRRWQAFTRKDAIHADSRRCFDELTADRIGAIAAAAA
jgi:hypothetical protein